MQQIRTTSGNWKLSRTDNSKGKWKMARRNGRISCDEEFSRVHGDMEWTLWVIRHVNKKFENNKGQWGAWENQSEIRTVQEWHAQTLINKQLKKENGDLKEIVESQGQQIAQLQHLVNGLYMNHGLQLLQDNNKHQAPKSSGQARHPESGFRPYKGNR